MESYEHIKNEQLKSAIDNATPSEILGALILKRSEEDRKWLRDNLTDNR